MYREIITDIFELRIFEEKLRTFTDYIIRNYNSAVGLNKNILHQLCNKINRKFNNEIDDTINYKNSSNKNYYDYWIDGLHLLKHNISYCNCVVTFVKEDTRMILIYNPFSLLTKIIVYKNKQLFFAINNNFQKINDNKFDININIQNLLETDILFLIIQGYNININMITHEKLINFLKTSD